MTMLLAIILLYYNYQLQLAWCLQCHSENILISHQEKVTLVVGCPISSHIFLFPALMSA